jgi:hypothetical protein
VLAAIGAVVALIAIAVRSFKRNPRIGSAFVNSVVNPAFVRRGLSGRGRSELGTLEHYGRMSGRRYLTPVHPEPTPYGFQIVVPLGEQSHWARNVLAAGHCRLLLHDVVYELDEPQMRRPTDLSGRPVILRRAEDYLGFEYLTLRSFASAPGSLDEPARRTVDVTRQPETTEIREAALAR